MPLFEKIPEAPIDPILGTTQLFNADPDPRKINLGVGAYRTNDGKPYVLPVVRACEAEMLEELGSTINKEYSTIDGPPELKKLTQGLLFGTGHESVTSDRIASVQALSGTGALRVASEFIKTHLPPSAHEIWVSEPTWGNHLTIFKMAGLAVKKYPYWDEATKSLDFTSMMTALRSASEGSMVLLHACAHNPTGVDPTMEQWREIANLMKEKRLIPMMDSAYQGYASGSLEDDAMAVRLFADMGFEFFMCQSFAKNLGLYGERIGMLHVVCNTSVQAKAVLSQLKLVIRPMYSSPPRHGAHLVMKVLGTAAKFEQWKGELKAMADRVLAVRAALRKGLEDKGTPGTWNHITDQIGMFSFTGLTPDMCERLTKVHHIYLLKSGRISLAGLNENNMEYMVNSVDETVRSCMPKGLFETIPEAPIDPILGTTQLFNADTDSRKINLGVGAYRTNDGKPFVLPVVRACEAEMLQELGSTINKEYSTIDGPPELKKLTQGLLFGTNHESVTSDRIASVQALSGTGALRVASEFIKTHLPPSAHEIWVSEPTWGNHLTIFKMAGLAVKKYPYWDEATKSLDFASMMNALQGASEGSMVLLHACAHNPTGVDPTMEQWQQIANLMKEKKLIPMIDSAYQGYASGSLEEDAKAVRLFTDMGFEFFMCQSFAKNLGLYGERIGMLHVVCDRSEQAKAVLSQLKLVIRPMYSSPPRHGAHLVMKVLGDLAKFEQWKGELKAMADRVLAVRAALRRGLEDKGTPGKWNHITDQIGMFSFTGLTPDMCERLTKVHHVYLLKSGRISLAGLNENNMEYMVNSVDETVRSCTP